MPVRDHFSHMFRALRWRNYRLFFTGLAVSLTGLWMTRMATQWLVYRLTDSPAMLGVVGFAQLAPSFVIAPLAGTLVDRWNRQRVLVMTQVGSMMVSLSLAALALSGVIEVWHVLILCAMEGAVRGFEIPARQALVVKLVEDRADLPNAIALNSSVFNSARLIGPALGGLAVWLVGEGLCFLIDGLSYSAVIVALCAMHLGADAQPADGARKSVLGDLREGFAYTFGFGPHRALVLLVGVIVLAAGAPQMALMPVFARDVFEGGSNTLGLLMASSGAGSLLSAMALAMRRSVRGLGRVLAGCAAGFGVTHLLFALSPNVWLAAAALFGGGFMSMTVMAGSNTVMQTLVSDDKRGRVMSLFVMAVMAAMPVGQLGSGALAERIGAPWTVACGGVVCLVMGGYFACRLPRLREQARPIYVERGIIGPGAAARLGIQPAGAGRGGGE